MADRRLYDVLRDAVDSDLGFADASETRAVARWALDRIDTQQDRLDALSGLARDLAIYMSREGVPVPLWARIRLDDVGVTWAPELDLHGVPKALGPDGQP